MTNTMTGQDRINTALDTLSREWAFTVEASATTAGRWMITSPNIPLKSVAFALNIVLLDMNIESDRCDFSITRTQSYVSLVIA